MAIYSGCLNSRGTSRFPKGAVVLVISPLHVNVLFSIKDDGGPANVAVISAPVKPFAYP